jgi:hypothetical protein
VNPSSSIMSLFPSQPLWTNYVLAYLNSEGMVNGYWIK